MTQTAVHYAFSHNSLVIPINGEL